MGKELHCQGKLRNARGYFVRAAVSIVPYPLAKHQCHFILSVYQNFRYHIAEFSEDIGKTILISGQSAYKINEQGRTHKTTRVRVIMLGFF